MSDKIKEELQVKRRVLKMLEQDEASLKFKMRELDGELNDVYERIEQTEMDIAKMEWYLKEDKS